jgi:hypothetical protein
MNTNDQTHTQNMMPENRNYKRTVTNTKDQIQRTQCLKITTFKQGSMRELLSKSRIWVTTRQCFTYGITVLCKHPVAFGVKAGH